MLTTAAFNAFLKTLEEPPHHALFILATTEKHKVLPTILSRCQIYDFSRISIADMVEHLQYVSSQEGVTAEPEALNVIAQKADGGMRDALSIFDQVVSFTNGNITYQAVIDNLNVLDYEYYFRLTDAILSGNVRASLLILNEILGKGFDGQNIITGLLGISGTYWYAGMSPPWCYSRWELLYGNDIRRWRNIVRINFCSRR